MAPDRPHPLVVWLAEQNSNLHRFAKEHHFPFRTLYDLVDFDTVKMPRLATLRKIETATVGAVTLRAQIAWYEEHPPKETEL